MPQTTPPYLTKIGQENDFKHKITGHITVLPSDQVTQTNIMGYLLPGYAVTINPLAIQGATKLKALKVIQLDIIVAYPVGATTSPTSVTILVGSDQPYTITLPVNNTTTTLATTSRTVSFPIQAFPGTQITIITSGAGGTFSLETDIFYNIYDYDIHPFNL